MLRSLVLCSAAGGILALAGCASSPGSSAGAPGADSPVTLQVPASVRDMAKQPSPPANAMPASSVGSDATQVSTADSSTDTDFVWTARLDVTGDGQVELTQVLWDDEDKVIILSSSTAFACANGGVGSGSVLIGLFANGNPTGAAVGSGSFAVELDESECGTEVAGLFGCDFDADGNPTACGEVTVDAATGEIEVVTASD